MSERDMEQRLGVCSWSLRAHDAQSLVEALGECGLRKVQLALNPLSAEPEAWGDVGDRLRDAGIEIVSGMFGCAGEDYSTLESIRRTGGLVLDADWDENFRIAERALNHAKSLGVSAITTHVGFIPHAREDSGYGKMIERTAAIADLYAASSVSLLLETGQETAEDLQRFLAELDRPNVGVNFDPANMILYDKGDPIEALRLLLPRVRQVHIKDAVRTETPGTWGKEVRAGEGDVDWTAFMDMLSRAEWDGNLVIEREAGEQRFEDVRAARDLMLQHASRIAPV